MVLPTYNLPPDVKDAAEQHVCRQGVGALEAQILEASSAGEPFQWRWPQEMVFLAREAINITGDMVLTDAHYQIPTHFLSGILDQVKTRLLDFVLGLQENNITAEDLDRRNVEPETIRNLFKVNIYGGQNIVASGQQVSQQVGSVHKGDIDALLNRLRELEVDDADLHDLAAAVSAEPDAPDGRYGPKVRDWVGGMISKAASSVWKIGVEAASKALTDALKGYYGRNHHL